MFCREACMKRQQNGSVRAFFVLAVPTGELTVRRMIVTGFDV